MMEENSKKKQGEKEIPDNIGETSRRDFMKKFGLYGAAAFAGGAAVYSGYKFEKDKGKDSRNPWWHGFCSSFNIKVEQDPALINP